LRLWGDLRTPDELYDLGALSPDAYRITQLLEVAGEPLGTRELREKAGFPTGKEQRAAYLKAVEELDTKMLLAKVFYSGSEDGAMSHALVAIRHPEPISRAEEMGFEEALHEFLQMYLPQAVYALPPVLARHVRLPEQALRSGLDRLVSENKARPPGVSASRAAYYAADCD
jgi:hypothetical protein